MHVHALATHAWNTCHFTRFPLTLCASLTIRACHSSFEQVSLYALPSHALCTCHFMRLPLTFGTRLTTSSASPTLSTRVTLFACHSRLECALQLLKVLDPHDSNTSHFMRLPLALGSRQYASVNGMAPKFQIASGNGMRQKKKPLHSLAVSSPRLPAASWVL